MKELYNPSLITYRPIKEADLEYRMRWLNDPEVNRYLGLRVRQGTDMTFHQEWFETYRNDKSREIFMVLYDDKPIGQVGLLSINLNDNNAELYIIIGEKEFRGVGLGKYLVQYIEKYGFETLHLHKIGLRVHAENIAGIKTYEKCGFVREGILRENVYQDDRYKDEFVMGLIGK